MRLEVRVLAVRAVKKGESVGYGAAETLKADGRVAILSAGYADGLLRAAGSADGHAGAAAMIAGTLCPFVGRVSMDLIAIDVSALPEASVTRGTIAEILNETLTVDRYGEAAGTIGYEVLTALGSRYARSYIGDPGDTR